MPRRPGAAGRARHRRREDRRRAATTSSTRWPSPAGASCPATSTPVAEYEAAKNEPLVLTPQAAPPWKAPHFVWQVREQLGALLCGEENAETCEAVDTGGYQVITTLDWDDAADRREVAVRRRPG